jgi:RNA polymerase sigma-70 factor (sigma-E family)
MTSEPGYDDFYVALWPHLVRTTYAVSGDLGVAEDAVQTAFAKAYRSWRRISRLESPAAYVRKMAVNEVLNTRRTAHARREVVRASLPDAPGPSPGDPGAHDEMWRAVSTLPPRQRAVLVLRYYEDLSEQQIADVLGCRPGTVKSQAAAALAALRTRLDDHTPAGEGRS